MAKAIAEWGLDYVVLTSVDRDEPHREDDIGAEASVEEEDHNRVSDAGLQREGGVHRGGGCERSERVRAQHRDGGAAVGGRC